jgi:hypothetical protein
MATVKVLRGFIGEVTAKQGEVIEVTDAYAKSLIDFGYVEPVATAATPVAAKAQKGVV